MVGCGQMGSGIAQVAAQAGCGVVVSDVNEELVRRGIGNVERFLTGSLERGKMSEEDKTTRWEDFGDR